MMKNTSLCFLILFILLPTVGFTSVLTSGRTNVLVGNDSDIQFRRTYPTSVEIDKECQRFKEQHQSLSADFRNTPSSSFLITQSDFESQLASGRDRIIRIIDEESASILMNVGGQEENQVWEIPDFTTFSSYELVMMQAIAPSATPYYSELEGEGFDGATHAFSLENSDLYAYYRVGEVEFEGGLTHNVVYNYGTIDATNVEHAKIIESPLPLTLDADPFGGSTTFNCADFDDEPCSDYPTAVTHIEKQTYYPQAVGTLNLFDDNPIQAIKVHLIEEIFYYDEFGDEVGYEFERLIVWYSEEGHYILALLDENAPWTESTQINYMEYQRLAPITLPIQWSDFSAKVNKQQEVKLHWQTATELNNSHFLVQKSKDGKSFTNIGEQASKGNSNTIQSYHFTDKTPVKGTNYYRIQQVDLDGKISFSEVITVMIDQSTIVLYPNPGKDEVWFSQSADYELFDTKGTLLTSGRANGAVDVSGLLAGAYFVRINGGAMQPWLKN